MQSDCNSELGAAGEKIEALRIVSRRQIDG